MRPQAGSVTGFLLQLHARVYLHSDCCYRRKSFRLVWNNSTKWWAAAGPSVLLISLWPFLTSNQGGTVYGATAKGALRADLFSVLS